jgi:hypothetical protein
MARSMVMKFSRFVAKHVQAKTFIFYGSKNIESAKVAEAICTTLS